jgi:hypothetical protein
MIEIYLIFLDFFIPIFMVLINITCNVSLMMVFRRKKFEKFSSKNYLSILALNDIFAITMIIPYNIDSYGITILALNEYSCKIITFIGFYFPATSSWLLALVNIERMITIKFVNVRSFGKISFQKILFSIVYFANLVIYICYSYFNQINSDVILISDQNSTNETIETSLFCGLPENNLNTIFSTLDLVNSLMMPFYIMSVCSLIIIHSIYLARKKMALMKKKEKNRQKFIKDIRFSSIILCLNFGFFIFNFPLCFYNFLIYNDTTDYMFPLINIIFNWQYIFNIFVYINLNKQFKNELKAIWKEKFNNNLMIISSRNSTNTK